MIPVPWIIWLQDLWRRYRPRRIEVPNWFEPAENLANAVHMHRRATVEATSVLAAIGNTTNERLDQVCAELRRLREG